MPKSPAQQAEKAMHVVKSKLSRFGDLNPGILFNVFDIKIMLILLYGSEVWFSHTSLELENIHNISFAYPFMQQCICSQ